MAPTHPMHLTPARIAFAGDWHGDIDWSLLAISHAATLRADVIVHLGDFGDEFRPEFVGRLTARLATAGIPLAFVDGNHEDHRWLATRPLDNTGLRPLSDWLWHIPRGHRWKWGEVNFLGLGGTHSMDCMRRVEEGDMWQEEESITEEQAQTAIRGGQPTDVLVSHDLPFGIDIPGRRPGRKGAPTWPWIDQQRAREQRQLLRKVAEATRPAAIWHGHHHIRYREIKNLGYGPVHIHGLDKNRSTIHDNMHLVPLHQLTELAAQHQAQLPPEAKHDDDRHRPRLPGRPAR